MSRSKKPAPPSEASTRASPSSPERTIERWTEHLDSVHWTHLHAHCPPITEGSSRFACFDLDGTIITTKSRKPFPIDQADWEYLDRKQRGAPQPVQTKLKALNEAGYRIVIFTNQKGVSTGTTKLAHICGKLEDIQDDLKIPITAFIFTQGDEFRKPLMGGWHLAVSEECNFGTPVDISNSFFVGDAAGRPKTKANPKDFSDTDLKFALNIGLRFYTPEMYFFHDNDRPPVQTFAFDPRALRDTTEPLALLPAAVDGSCEVVILVGPPGAGKTCLFRKVFCGSGYVHVNQDVEKTTPKCLAMCKASLKSGSSVVVDSQNKEAAKRKLFIDIAAERDVPVRCVYFDVPKDYAFHLNTYRTLVQDCAEHRKIKVPDMVIHTFYKYLEPPQISEGIDDIYTINLRNLNPGPFESKRAEVLFHSFLR